MSSGLWRLDGLFRVALIAFLVRIRGFGIRIIRLGFRLTGSIFRGLG
jgi:hypothetical protein